MSEAGGELWLYIRPQGSQVGGLIKLERIRDVLGVGQAGRALTKLKERHPGSGHSRCKGPEAGRLCKSHTVLWSQRKWVQGHKRRSEG